MKISIIVAMDERGGIGHGNKIPWRLSGDMKKFKSLTMGHIIVMGRKTHESIGKALPGRLNIVLSRRKSFRSQDCLSADSMERVLEIADSYHENELFIIGGAEIYNLFLPVTNRIYMTRVHTSLPDVDTYFPPVALEDWIVVESDYNPPDNKNEYGYTFQVWERR